MAGIYIHIPFCKQACHYCDFHFSTNLDQRAQMVSQIARELLLNNDYLDGEAIDTIYLGGGTPSMLNADELEMLISAIYEHYKVAADTEITLEANPDDLTSATALQSLSGLGINRLSIGIQSFDNNILKFLNRAHDATQAENCIALARDAGFRNISIDLIYAIPGQDLPLWQANIRKALALNPEHISAYTLTIEKNTVFGNWFEKGRLIPLKDENEAAQFETLIDELEESGYQHYEVSNFSKPGFESRHNSSYWKQRKYLGVGPGAHSYNGRSRQFNIANNPLYIKSMMEGVIPFQLENLSHEDHVNEYLLTTLRTRWGTDLNFLKERYGYDVLEFHRNYVNALIERNLAVIENGFVRLTRGGKMLADKISVDLFLEHKTY